jgi:two-component system, NtrC family, sensor kinase
MTDNFFTILLIEDEKMISTLLSRALKKNNYNVLLATSKAEAFEVFMSNNIDLVICDKNLPDGTGLEFIETTRNLDFNGEAIVITGYSDTDSAIKAVELGVFRYIKKPFDLDALLMDVQRALETSTLKKALENRTLELEQKNKNLQAALEKIKESENRRIQAERLASIGYLSAGIAHEINNPLSLLAMTIPYSTLELTSLLEAKEKTSQQTDKALKKVVNTLQSTQDAVDLLMTLSSDLHSLGRNDNSKPTDVHLYEVINSALRIVRHKLKNKARISVNIPTELTIKGKTNRLIQVFINLLTNSARAITENDLEKNKVCINGFEDEEHVVIEVADTGKGIKEENIKEIFEPFISCSGLGPKEGSGIGLAIVKELIEEHDGTVEVVSEYGKGTSFYIKFPIKNVRRSCPPPVSVAPRMTPNNYIRAQRTILFIDHQLEHLQIYQDSFGQMHQVLTANSFDKAYEIVDDHILQLDILVCEVAKNLPQFKEFYKRMTAQFKDLKNHFICTANKNTDLTDINNFNIPVLIRPFRPAELLSIIYKTPPRKPSEK